MEFKQLLSKIETIRKQKELGWKSHKIMAPKLRKEFNKNQINHLNPKNASVLILLYPKNNKTHILLTKRASYNGVHSAQISFPGGKFDKKDITLYKTALREAEEEVNINQNDIYLIKKLSKTYIPPSNFWVYPFLSYSKKRPDFIKNYEVDEILEVPISDLFNEKNVVIKDISTSYMKNAKIPCFYLNNKIVWGATAMILSELKETFKNI